MRIKTLGLAVLLGLATACGNDMATTDNGPSHPSGNGTSADGGTASDGGTSSGITDAGEGSTCDCTGLALPAICMVCTDGQTACAHFVCEGTVCETQLCP